MMYLMQNSYPGPRFFTSFNFFNLLDTSISFSFALALEVRIDYALPSPEHYWIKKHGDR
jgi:hypothetical protein